MSISAFSLNACRTFCVALAMGSLLAPAAVASPVFTVTYLAAGVQTPGSITSYYETFNSTGFVNGTTNTTTFNGSSITGTYTGSYEIKAAGEYGGAGGTGDYLAVTPGNTATLTLSAGVNYFGLWFSALDAGNVLKFYDGSTLVETFNAQSFISGVGACSSSNLYCGNPNNHEDSNEQFAYINFYDMSGTFNKITFSESGSGNFEADNNAVANIDQGPGGTVLSATPEPSSLVLMGTGVSALAAFVRRRSFKAV